MNLMETILNAQNGDVVRQIAGALNLDESQARSAVGALVPALSRGISSNASSNEGLQGLIGALASGRHDQYIEQPATLAGPAAVSEGNGILGHIFGSKEVSRDVAAQAAQATGLDSGLLKQMLPLLASAAMGALSKQGIAGSAAAGGEQAGGITSLLSGFLDADKDGSVIDDVMGMASRFLR